MIVRIKRKFRSKRTSVKRKVDDRYIPKGSDGRTKRSAVRPRRPRRAEKTLSLTEATGLCKLGHT